MRWLSVMFVAVGCTGQSGGGIELPEAGIIDAAADAQGDAPAPPDAIDSGVIVLDGGLPPLLVPDPTMGRVLADYSCNGTRTDPPGAAAEFTVDGTIVDFQTLNAVPGAVVESSIDGATAYDAKTADATGHFVALRIPANHYRLSFRTTAAPNQVETWEIGVPVPPGATTVRRFSVSHVTEDGLPAAVGLTHDVSKALALAVVEDCQGRTVQGAVGSAGGVPDNQIFYFGGQNLPLPRNVQWFTGINGWFLGFDLPAGTGALQAEGMPASAPSVQIIARAQTPRPADGIAIVQLPPLGP